MALEQIDPLKFENFKFLIGDDVKIFADIIDWENYFKNYSYLNNGQKFDFNEGVKIRKELNSELRKADNNEKLAVFNKIIKWGGLPEIDKDKDENLVEQIIKSLNILDNENTMDLKNVYAKTRIASVSKIYEMWDLCKWIIYDSYCSRGLQWIVKQFWEKIKCKRNFCILNFPQPPGKSEKNKPIEGFPRNTSENQFRFAFIYASWLCRLIAQELNLKNKSDFKWESYHVEMALFTLGHTVDM